MDTVENSCSKNTAGVENPNPQLLAAITDATQTYFPSIAVAKRENPCSVSCTRAWGGREDEGEGETLLGNTVHDGGVQGVA